MTSLRPAAALLSLSLSLALALALFSPFTLTAAASSGVSVAPGLVVSVSTNSSSGSTHLLAWDPETGLSRSGPAIAPWWHSWDQNASVVIDPASAFGDFFLHEDGLVYYLLFLSNTAHPRSQRMTQYVLYDPTVPGGWVAPTPGSSCMITQSSSAVQPALEAVHMQRELGTMIGFTDFALQDEAVRSNSSFLGLVSLMWNQPTCFLWPILSFAQGLPTPLKNAAAAALQQDSEPLTFSYVGAVGSDAAGQPSASIVMLDVSSPLNATLLPPPSVAQARFSLAALNVTDPAQFSPALIAGQSPSPNQPTFGLVQVAPASASPAAVSGSTGKRGNKQPATYLQFDDAHPTVDGTAALGFFPTGPATTALATDAGGRTFTTLLGLVSNAGDQSAGNGAAAFFTALDRPWTRLGAQVDPEWILQAGATLSFVPRSIVPSTPATAASAEKQKQKPSFIASRLAERKNRANTAAVAAASPDADAVVSSLVSSPLADSTGGGDPDYHRPDNGPPLSTGQIVLIVVLVVAFFGGLCACWVLFERRRAAQQGVDPGLALTATQRKAHLARMSKREEIMDEDGVAMGMAYEPPSPSRGRSSMSFSQDI